MAALAYLMLPFTGLAAFAFAAQRRVRFHGMQSICFSMLWGTLLIAGARIAPGITLGVWAAGAATWVALIVSAALGRDLVLPGMGALWGALGQEPLRDEGRNTSGSSAP